VIVFPSSSSGFNGEHSLLDGTPTLRMNEFILSALAKNKIDLEPSSSQGERSAEPVELKWELDDKAKKDVEEARKVHGETMGNHKLEALHYTGYGSSSRFPSMCPFHVSNGCYGTSC
jgi:carnitine O-acetyltransferase